MNTLARRDKIINHLQSLIDNNKMLLGGSGLTSDEKDKLRTLENYLKEHKPGGEKDLATVRALLT
jgi:hypothetical protein